MLFVNTLFVLALCTISASDMNFFYCRQNLLPSTDNSFITTASTTATSSEQFIKTSKKSKVPRNRPPVPKNIDLRKIVLQTQAYDAQSESVLQLDSENIKEDARRHVKYLISRCEYKPLLSQGMLLILQFYQSVEDVRDMSECDLSLLIKFALLVDVHEVLGQVYKGMWLGEERIRPMFKRPAEQLKYLQELKARAQSTSYFMDLESE